MSEAPLKIVILGRANYGLLQTRIQQLSVFPTEIHLISLQHAEIENCTVHTIRPRVPTGPFKYLAAIPAIRKMIRQIDPDVVDVHGMSAYGAYGLFPLKAYPYLATIYGPDITMHARKHRLLARMANACFQKAQTIFSSTPITLDIIRDLCRKDYSPKYVARSWGIHTERILNEGDKRREAIRAEFQVPDGSRVVLHNRQFTPFWHIDQILDAAYRLLAERKDLVFWFVYPITNAMGEAFILAKQAEIESAGFSDRIVLHGPQDYERMISFMHGSDIYLCMGENDQLSSSVLEAMCCGMIPVLHDLPAYHEVVEHAESGYYVKDITPTNLCTQLSEVLDNFEQIHADMSERNRAKMIADYDETPCVAWLIDQYRAIKAAKETLAISKG